MVETVTIMVMVTITSCDQIMWPHLCLPCGMDSTCFATESWLFEAVHTITTSVSCPSGIQIPPCCLDHTDLVSECNFEKVAVSGSKVAWMTWHYTSKSPASLHMGDSIIPTRKLWITTGVTTKALSDLTLLSLTFSTNSITRYELCAIRCRFMC